MALFELVGVCVICVCIVFVHVVVWECIYQICVFTLSVSVCVFQINTGEVDALLGRLPCTFRQELTGVGASLEKRWKFCGFEGIKSK